MDPKPRIKLARGVCVTSPVFCLPSFIESMGGKQGTMARPDLGVGCTMAPLFPASAVVTAISFQSVTTFCAVAMRGRTIAVRPTTNVTKVFLITPPKKSSFSVVDFISWPVIVAAYFVAIDNRLGYAGVHKNARQRRMKTIEIV